MKITKHAKIRIKERTDLDKRQRKSLFRYALRNGKNAQDIKDERIKKFIYNHLQNNCYIKLYKGYVFIYSKNSKRLYTMYELPEYLKGSENNDK